MKNESSKLQGTVCVLLSFALFYTVSGFFTRLTENDGYIKSLIPYAAGFISATAVMLLCNRYLKNGSVKNEIAPDAEDAAKSAVRSKKMPFVINSLILSAILIGANFLYAAVTDSTNIPDTEDLVIRCAVGTLIKPAAEEYLFRVLYLNTLISSGIKPYVAAMTQAVLFALMHGISSAPFALFAGIMLGLLACYTEEKHKFKSVYTAHAVYNGILYLVLAVLN